MGSRKKKETTLIDVMIKDVHLNNLVTHNRHCQTLFNIATPAISLPNTTTLGRGTHDATSEANSPARRLRHLDTTAFTDSLVTKEQPFYLFLF